MPRVTDPANPYLRAAPEPVAPPRYPPATVLRAIALGLYLIAVVGPGISFTFGFANENSILPFFIAGLARFAVAIVLTAAAAMGGKRVGVGIALALASIAVIPLQFIYVSELLYLASFTLVAVLPAFSWAVSRPFRGPGYAAIGGGALLQFAYPYLIPVSQAPFWLLNSAIELAIVVASVALAITLERPRTASAGVEPGTETVA